MAASMRTGLICAAVIGVGFGAALWIAQVSVHAQSGIRFTGEATAPESPLSPWSARACCGSSRRAASGRSRHCRCDV